MATASTRIAAQTASFNRSIRTGVSENASADKAANYAQELSFNKWWLLPSLIFFLLFIPVTASANSVEHFAKLNDITQDKRGFVWLSGHHGISRFDGENLIDFSANNNNNQWQVPFNWTHEIEHYGDKFIVSSENNGSWLFDPVTKEYSSIPIETEKSSHYHTLSLNNKFYTYSANKVYEYDPQTNQTKEVFRTQGSTYLQKTSSELYLRVVTDGIYIYQNNQFNKVLDGRTYVSKAVGDRLVVLTREKLSIIEDDEVVLSLAIKKNVRGLAQEHNSTNFFTISELGEIKKYSSLTLEEVPHEYGRARKGRVKIAFHDSSNVLWLASNLGVERLVESEIKNHPIMFDITNNSNDIEIFENQLIIGSYGAGLHPFDTDSSIFPDDINRHFTRKGLKIMDLVSAGNMLYIATFDGVWGYNSQTQELAKLDFQGNDKLLIRLHYLDGLLYIATNYHGLYIYDIEKKLVIDHFSVDRGLLSTEVIDILPFDDGSVWMTSTKGVTLYNRFTKSVKNMPARGAGKYISLAVASNKIFAATKGDGIHIFDRQGTLLSIIASGIEFSYSNIIQDKIWLGTDSGIYQVDPVSHQFSLMANTERFAFSGEPMTINNKAYLAHFGGILEIPLSDPAPFDAPVYIGKIRVSGEQSFQNKLINVNSTNDVITLDLVSLDYRPGRMKQFKYKVNEGSWNNINGSQLTLTGLASGSYHIEIMGTNSLGEWSPYHAFANIDVAFPWYWTPQLRIIYLVTIICVLLMFGWIFYLRAQSISKIHHILDNEYKEKGLFSLSTQRNIKQTLSLLEEGDIQGAKTSLEQSLQELQASTNQEEPDNLYGKNLAVGLSYLADYLQHKYHVKLKHELYNTVSELPYELQANLYKITYEAITCAILHGDGRNFHVSIQEFKDKLWLTVSDDESSFTSFTHKVSFDMSMYFIRQIASNYNATVNTFAPNNDKGSQIVLSFPILAAA